MQPSYPFKRGNEELYDLSVDPGEENNIARENPELLAMFRRELKDRRNQRLDMDIGQAEAKSGYYSGVKSFRLCSLRFLLNPPMVRLDYFRFLKLSVYGDLWPKKKMILTNISVVMKTLRTATSQNREVEGAESEDGESEDDEEDFGKEWEIYPMIPLNSALVEVL